MAALDRHFTKKELFKLLSKTDGKTLGQVDVKNVFDITKSKPKITGIAGMVVEQSVLGCTADNLQEPDIIIDGVHTEVKTTGLKNNKNKNTSYKYVAKERMSITAVSINHIVNEEFPTSHFWNKLEHLLFVYYHYNSEETVLAQDYAKFPFLGYHLYEFNNADRERLKNDWCTVRDFLRQIHKEYPKEEDRKKQYPRLSHELRGVLTMIDTAPKYPNSPRFRLKESVITTIFNEYYSKKKTVSLKKPIIKYTDVDAKCHELTLKYKNKPVSYLLRKLKIEGDADTKNIAEKIITTMFGQQGKRINQIDDFAKIGLRAQKVPLYANGTSKEDMKLGLTVDFKEWADTNIADFEESEVYRFFSEHSFLCIVFQRNNDDDAESEMFKGFKRITFSEEFIQTEVRQTWNDVRDVVINKKLKRIPIKKKNGEFIINPKSKTLKSELNLPKEEARFGYPPHKVFLKGTGQTASENCMTEEVNGVKMLVQNVWIDGDYINQILSKINYL